MASEAVAERGPMHEEMTQLSQTSRWRRLWQASGGAVEQRARMQKLAWRARPEQAPARRRSVRTSECYLLMPKNPLLWRVRLRARGRRFRSDAKWEALSDLESARWWKHGTRRVDGTGRAYRSFWRMGRSSLSGRTGTLLTGSRRGRNFAPSARSDGTEFCFCTLHASGQSKYSESCDGSSSRERKGPAWSFGLRERERER